MLVMQTIMPNLGVGKLRNRDNPRVMGTDKERTHMQPEELFYKRLGVECSRNQICVDMLVCASGFMDVASLAPLSKFTGGQLSYFNAFRADKDGPEFESTIDRILTRETGKKLQTSRYKCLGMIRLALTKTLACRVGSGDENSVFAWP